jgi:hypothetical protein
MDQLQLVERHFRIARLCFRLAFGLAVIAVGLLSGIALAQTPAGVVVSPADAAAAAAAVPAPAQPAWLALILGLTPWLVTVFLGFHLLKHLGGWLAADGAARGGVLGAVEKGLGVAADDLDDLLSANGQSVKDLADPAKRAMAEAALAAQAQAQAKKVIDDALKAAGRNKSKSCTSPPKSCTAPPSRSTQRSLRCRRSESTAC